MSLLLAHWYSGSGVVLIPNLCTLTHFVLFRSIFICVKDQNLKNWPIVSVNGVFVFSVLKYYQPNDLYLYYHISIYMYRF